LTLVIAWRTQLGLTVCADTRIEAGDPLTDSGQKLFNVPVEVTLFGLEEKVVHFPSVGFAFAGNTLMAQSCCAIASTALSNLSAAEADQPISPEAIAEVFARSAEYVSLERRFLSPRRFAGFQAIVFGWDTVAGEPFIFGIEIEESDGALCASAERKHLTVGGLIYFGSGTKFVDEQIDELVARKAQGVPPYRLVQAAIADISLRSVGGSMQFGTAGPNGVRLRPTMRVSNTGMAEISILGCDIHRLMGNSGLFPGANAMTLTEGLDLNE
jgi:hypothetical protein